MTTPEEMKSALIDNLKLFNAKERDHLMRFAYLGRSTRYREDTVFLNEDFDRALRKVAGISEKESCAFAGMDYHLDWLFAALWMATNRPEWKPGIGNPPRVPMKPHESVDGIDDLYSDFRPLTGSQEDVDLLVVYDDGEKLSMVLVEAKGGASFNKVQLARKLIRLDRILSEPSVARIAKMPLESRLVLAAPTEPKFRDCLDFAKSLPEPDHDKKDKFELMRAALISHPSGIGSAPRRFLKIGGFEEKPFAVIREREVRSSKTGPYTHWTLVKR